MKVTGEEELEEAMQPFTSPETRMQPMLLEVFTDKEKDTTLLREYYHGLKIKMNNGNKRMENHQRISGYSV